MPKTLLIRADAGAKIGAGHVMRCLALAQAWRKAGGRADFVMAAGASELHARLRSEGSGVLEIGARPGSEDDARQTRELCKKKGASWLAIDGFHFKRAYCAHASDGTSRLLLLDDDGGRAPYGCDLVLNVNPQAAKGMYRRREKHTRLLLGPRFALIRAEFLAFRGRKFAPPERARRILITFGGADPHNVTQKVIQALQGIRDLALDLTAIVGGSNPHYRALQQAAVRSAHAVRLLLNVDNMAEYMSQADLAITAGGGTCYELALMRVPMFLLTMAQNHERTVEAWSRANAAVAGGWFDSLTTEALGMSLASVINNRRLREKLRARARRVVDGRGAERVVKTMLQVARRGTRTVA